MTIHWVLSEINRTMRNGHVKITAAHAKSTRFFKRVSVWVSLTASPKQPQSFTGFQIAIQAVIKVITIMKTSITFEVARRRILKSTNMPRLNSRDAKTIEVPSVIQSGSMPASPALPR